jgi:hypothetical protein
MAEYIDKVQAMNIIASGKNDNAYFGTTDKDWEVIDFLKTVPTANVVEKEMILDFIGDNRPTDIQTDWERGCVYICDKIEKLLI